MGKLVCYRKAITYKPSSFVLPAHCRLASLGLLGLPPCHTCECAKRQPTSPRCLPPERASEHGLQVTAPAVEGMYHGFINDRSDQENRQSFPGDDVWIVVAAHQFQYPSEEGLPHVGNKSVPSPCITPPNPATTVRVVKGRPKGPSLSSIISASSRVMNSTRPSYTPPSPKSKRNLSDRS